MKYIFEESLNDVNIKFCRNVAENLLTRDEVYTDVFLEILDNKSTDIRLVLSYLAVTLPAKSYLEIGVRRGLSMAMVASRNPRVKILGCETWDKNYGGVSNPGSEFVSMEMKSVGHKGKIQWLNGDSNKMIPLWKEDNPRTKFDLILVDGDHSPVGVGTDLANTIPLLKKPGFIVIDDLDLEGIQEEVENAASKFGLGFANSEQVGLIWRK